MAEIQNVQKLRNMYSDVEDNMSAINNSIKQVNQQQEELTEEKDAIEDAVMNEASKKISSYIYGKAYSFEYFFKTYKGFWKSGETYTTDDIVTIVNDSTGEHYFCIQNNTSDENNEPATSGGAGFWDDAPPLVTTQVIFGGSFGNVNILNAITDWIIQEELVYSSSYSSSSFVPPTPYWSDIYIYDGVGWDNDEQIITLRTDWRFAHDYIHKPLGTGSSPATYGINANINALEGAKEILNNNTNKIKDSKGVFAKYVQPNG
jgi:hypothetical protein